MENVCSQRILDLVASFRLGEGDRLPGERELASRLGFSRNTVREALVGLAARGRVEVRKRSGCYLISTSPATSWNSVEVEAGKIIDTLCAIGPHLAARVARRCSAEQMARLETITSRLGRHVVNRDGPQMTREFMTFYVALAAMADNPYLELLMKELAGARNCLTQAASFDRSNVETFFASQVNLLQAIQTHVPRRAKLLAEQGIDAFMALLGCSDDGYAKEKTA